jgi:Cu2+-exporting ATPase
MVKAEHDKHAGHNVSDFWKRFIVCSIVSIPVLALSHMIQQWLGFEFTFAGDKYVLAVLSTFIFHLWWLSFSERLV